MKMFLFHFSSSFVHLSRSKHPSCTEATGWNTASQFKGQKIPPAFSSSVAGTVLRVATSFKDGLSKLENIVMEEIFRELLISINEEGGKWWALVLLQPIWQSWVPHLIGQTQAQHFSNYVKTSSCLIYNNIKHIIWYNNKNLVFIYLVAFLTSLALQ